MAGGPSEVPEEFRMQHLPGAQEMEIAPWDDEGTPAFFEDVITNNNSDAPMTCALFRMEAGEDLVFTYDYDDIKIMLEGSMTISDGESTITAEEGDVLFFPSGSTITFSSDDYGLGWACGNG